MENKGAVKIYVSPEFRKMIERQQLFDPMHVDIQKRRPWDKVKKRIRVKTMKKMPKKFDGKTIIVERGEVSMIPRITWKKTSGWKTIKRN